MNISQMRVVDRYLGVVVVWLLRPITGLWNTIRKVATKEHPPQTIVIQKYFGIGSIINALPGISKLRERFPNARIVFVTFKSQEKFVSILDCVDEVIAVNERSLPAFFGSTLCMVFTLWVRRVDICIDMEFFSKYSMIVSVLSGAHGRIGFFSWDNPRSALLTHPISFNHYAHISQAYKVLCAAADEIDHQNEYFNAKHRIHLPSFANAYDLQVEPLLPGANSDKVVVINAMSSDLCELRAWPAEHFASLLKKLLKDFPQHRVAMIGTQDQKEGVARVVKLTGNHNGRLIDLAGRTSFEMMLGLLERCDLLITNDGGPAHIAAAYQTSVVVMFGPETPVMYKPLHDNVYVHYRPPYCSPCINVLDNKRFEDCDNPVCLNGISPDEVYASVVSVLRKAVIDA